MTLIMFHWLREPVHIALVLLVLLPLRRHFRTKDRIHRNACSRSSAPYDSTYRQIWVIFTVVVFLLLLMLGGYKQKGDTNEPRNYTDRAR